jgi:endonuclease/exonuclease/phosphatase family metal-dependent hydrolase
MMQLIRLYAKRMLWIGNILVAVLLLCTKLIPYINPSTAWPIGLLGLATPFIAGANIVFIVIWLLFKKWKNASLSIIAIILSWNIFSVGIGGNIAANKRTIGDNSAFSVMSYNVRLLNYYNWNTDKNTRQNMLQFFKQQNASVLCLQEFFSGEDDAVDNVKAITESCGYAYTAINKQYITKRGFFGDIIFSKYPISKQETVLFDNATNYQYQYADILIAKQTYRVFNLHLQSIKLSTTDLELVDKNANEQNAIEQYQQTKDIIKKLRTSFAKRGLQAATLHNAIAQSPLPAIVCGDMNDIPSSYTYFSIRGKLHDAFLDKGFGLGRTYNTISPVLRIDNLFYDAQQIQLYSYTKHIIPYSDHYPIIAVFGKK